MEEAIIPLEREKQRFLEFLNKEGNNRIFLSGIFGSGKTFFLRDFFKEHSGGSADKYDTYHLFPVRYQISSNDDAVNLLKYDLLVQIFEKNAQILQSKKGTKSSLKKRVSEFAQNLDWDEVLEVVPKIGRPLKITKDMYAAWRDTGKEANGSEILKFREDMEKTLSNSLDLFLEEKVREGKKKGKSVLVLDDFDRMDPEHIFRILNVISAQSDYIDEPANIKNMFAFDHIVIAGDIDNIKNIFRHRYGENTDFQGYFDKFFTIRPYRFDIIQETIGWLEQFAFDKMHSGDDVKGLLESLGYIRIISGEILRQAIKLRAINLRQLRLPTEHLLEELERIQPIDRRLGNTWEPFLRMSCAFLAVLCAGKGNFLAMLKRIRNEAPEFGTNPIKNRAPGARFYGATIEEVWTDWSERRETFTHEEFYDRLIKYVESLAISR